MKTHFKLLFLAGSFIYTTGLWADGGCEKLQIEQDKIAFEKKMKGVNPQSEKALELHRQRIREMCADYKDIEFSKNSINAILLTMAKNLEAKGEYYFSKVGPHTAFSRYEELEDFKNADRVGVLALKKFPNDLDLHRGLLNAAMNYQRKDKKHDSTPLITEVEKSAEQNAQRLMAEENKIFNSLKNVGTMQFTQVAIQSLELLKLSSSFFQLTKKGDTLTKKTAESHGDSIFNSGEKGIQQLTIVQQYYQYAESPKISQVKIEVGKHDMQFENVGKNMKNSIKAKDSSDSEKFKKGADDLENELGM